MTKTLAALIACVLLCGCLPRETTLPDRSIVHRVAKPVAVVIWVRRADGSLVEESVRLEPGWYVAAPEIVDAESGQ